MSEYLTKLTLDVMGKEDQFYGQFLLELNRKIDNKADTAYLNNKAKVIGFNEEFMKSLSDDEQRGVMVHEIMHFLCMHDDRYFNTLQDIPVGTSKGTWHHLCNIAMDIAINCLIPNAPRLGGKAAHYDNFKDIYPKMEHNQTFEYYVKFFLDNNAIKRLGDYTSLDFHGDFEKMTEAEKEELKQALNATKAKCRGNIPGHINEIIKALGVNKVNWRSELRRFITRITDINKTESKKRKNRRYPFPIPGHKRLTKRKIGVIIDESGSVSSEYLSQFLTEMNSISRNDTQIYLVTCDAEVTFKGVYKPSHEFNFKGRGGTVMAPAFEAIRNVKDLGGIVMFSDMDFYGKEDIPDPRIPVLFVSTTSKPSPLPFGRNISLGGGL